MTWELSMSPGGWVELRRAVQRTGREELAKALGDYNHDRFHGCCTYHGADPKRRGAWSYRKLMKLDRDHLADAVMDAIEFTSSSSNGGHAAYVDCKGYHQIRIDDGILDCQIMGCESKCTGEDSDEGWDFGPATVTRCPDHNQSR